MKTKKVTYAFTLLILTAVAPFSCSKENKENSSFSIDSISATPATIKVGNAITFTVDISNPHDEKISYNWTGFCNKQIGTRQTESYYPQACCVGTDEITCTVSDAGGNSVSKSVTVSVEK